MNRIPKLCLGHYKSLPRRGKPEIGREWTLLAGIVKEEEGSLKVVSLATGSKCIGQSKYDPKGETLKDGHAEVLAKRAFLRYLYHQLTLAYSDQESIFILDEQTHLSTLKDGIRFHFFTSNTPCGDASIIPKDLPSDGQEYMDHLDCNALQHDNAQSNKEKKRGIDEPSARETKGKRLRRHSAEESKDRSNCIRINGACELSDLCNSLGKQEDHERGQSAAVIEHSKLSPSRTESDPLPHSTASNTEMDTFVVGSEDLGSISLNVHQEVKESSYPTTIEPHQLPYTKEYHYWSKANVSASKTPTSVAPTDVSEVTCTKSQSCLASPNRTVSSKHSTSGGDHSFQQTDAQNDLKKMHDVTAQEYPCGPCNGKKDIHRTGAKCAPGERQDPKLDGVAYHVTGALRTKPGRGDPSLSMSCSDKMMRWVALGCQGALLSHFLGEPIRLSSVTVSGCPYSQAAMERALIQRLQKVDFSKLPHSYRPLFPSIISAPEVCFEDSREEVAARHDGTSGKMTPSGSAIIWCSVPSDGLEVSANGKKLGVTAKNWSKPQSQCRISSASLFSEFQSLLSSIPVTKRPKSLHNGNLKTYAEFKSAAMTYQEARKAFMEAFPNWVQTQLDFTI